MLEADGPIFGQAYSANFVNRCADLISTRDPQAHIEVMRMTLALGNARVQGMIDAIEDPFLYKPGAQDRLADIIEELDATDTITPQEWRLMYDDGIMTVNNAGSCSPAMLAASLVNLHIYAKAEAETLTLFVMAAGVSEEVAERTAASTSATGIATCVLGDFEKWAAVLSRTNMETFQGISETCAESCRYFQVTTLKRFAKIRIIDDIESAHEEQAAQNFAIMQALNNADTQKMRNF